ncbi:hypothetical protein SAMN02745248_02130 [Hathewaya proteolytica DSM 3090]|uniref:Nucleoside recognition n=1 Tax=Hathewaya proteolytica DSM 3090 TaxID=1121331 RepID=A0A1M6QU60_9CLOT|nr:hypothetical protein [Hathewaya proteolytica]SHK23859.1 hypothetical protein SAMN02745248_02130 [Hathewaya proteolytica DSM 3090]
MEKEKHYKKAIGLEGFICTVVFFGFFIILGSIMGAPNMFNTLMETGFDLLVNTVLKITALAVIAGAAASILSEFGVVSLINKLLSPLMKPLYDLPGVASLGILTTYLSDNPAIITLADNKVFLRYFKKYQVPALTNLGTSFGMGLILTAFMIGQTGPKGETYILSALIGNVGAVVGSVISCRLMIHHTKKEYGTELPAVQEEDSNIDTINYREVREGSVSGRILESMLEGGKSGVDMGVAIVPGVIIICTLVMMLTMGPGASGKYTGAAYEGVPLFPWIGKQLSFILEPLLGFKSPEAIAFPITSLGAVGAAISLVPNFLKQGLIGGNEIAVFTAMGMCWSGYLSTHVAMMDSLKFRHLTGRAIVSHTIGGLCAGVVAHLLFLLTTLL